jgi:hypothetical protein
MRITARLIFGIAVLLAGAGGARAADCKTVTDPQERLACFDAAVKPAPAKPAAAAAKKTVAPRPDEFAAAKAAMIRKLTDPDSAKWTDLFRVNSPEDGPIVCGMVNAKTAWAVTTAPRVSCICRRSTRRS